MTIATRWTQETTVSVHRWTDQLLSFRTTRAAEFRCKPGHYARIGLGEGESLEWRPLSVVSSPDETELEFFAILVPEGRFSRHLSTLAAEAPVLIEKACYGFLTLDQLGAGEDLWLLASGTGLGPFVAMLRHAETWRQFKRITLVHSVRLIDDLAYRAEIEAMVERSASGQDGALLRYLPTVTRENHPGVLSARIPDLVDQGTLEQAAGITLDKARSRVMACGNPELMKTLRAQLAARGFEAGRRGAPGQMAFEKYW